MKVLEIKSAENNEFFDLEYSYYRDEKEFEYLRELDFEKLNNLSQVSETETINVLYDYIVENDYVGVMEFAEFHFDSDEVNTLKFKRDCVTELGQYYLNTREAFESVAENLGLRFGTVGYSDWTYYISRKDITHTFISDLWEGYNYYDLRIITFMNGIEVDSDYYGTLYNPACRFKDFDITGYDKVLNNTDIQYIGVPKELLINGHYEELLILGGE